MDLTPIQALRASRKLSIDQVANVMRCESSTVFRLENVAVAPDPALLVLYSNALGLPVCDVQAALDATHS